MVSLFLFSFTLVYNQENSESGIVAAEDHLKISFETLYTAPTDAEKEKLNREILDTFESVLQNPLAFDYPFDSLRRIGKIYSPDHRIRLITWNIPAQDGTHTCYGFIQSRYKKKEPCMVYRLVDRSGEIENPESSVLDPSHWWGALYYDIIQIRSKGRKLYTLIGFDPNDRYSNKKILDILSSGRDLDPSFGEPLFVTDEGIWYRLIFEFSPDIVMRLRYEPDLKMIILDHLSPIQPVLEGNYRFYAPDGSYDGFRFRKGIWQYLPDIDVRNP